MSDLERALVALGRDLEVPELPELVPAVMSRIAERRRPLPKARLVLAFAVVLVVPLSATLAIPNARSELLRVLHIGGEEIVRVEQLPSVEPQPELGRLGRLESLAAARRGAGFRVRVPDELPDSVYVGAGGTIWFLYGTPMRVELLIAQTPHAHVDRSFLQKLIAAGTKVEEVEVNSSPGVFLSGAPHEVIFLDERGRPRVENTRLARNVLVWSQGGVAYRLEGDFSRDEALDFARSLH